MNTTTNDRKAGVEVMDKAMGMYITSRTLRSRPRIIFQPYFLASIKEEIEKFPTGKFVLKKTIENVVEEDPNASGQKDQESDQKVSQGHARTVTVIWDGNVFFVTGDP